MKALETQFDFVPAPADDVLFTKQVLRELEDIREEVAETCAVADNVLPVPACAYDETLSLLKSMSRDIPLPDMMWLEDGGIGLEWRPGHGIATVSLYGDGLAIYGATWQGSREISGTCLLSDSVLLPHFLNVLREGFSVNAGMSDKLYQQALTTTRK